MARSHAPHALLEQAAIVNGKVALAQLPVIDAVEALDGAVIEDPTVLPLVGALVCVLFRGVVGEAADVAVDIFSRAFALLRHVGEDVAAGA